jgi:type VI secretion system secreted protein Hcp
MAASMFLKIKSIPGPSTVKGFENTIEILSFSWGGQLPSVSQSSASAETTGQAHLGELTISKYADKSSPLLFANMTGGKRMAEDVELDINKILDNNSQTFASIKLTNAIVSSFNTSGGGAGEPPVESISFNYVKVYFGYANEDKGKLEAMVIKGWDGTTHQPL